jgi:hypothetical protein
MKFILLHHRLGGYGSHHFNESLGFQRELARRGRKLRLLVSANALPKVVKELGARAVLEDSTFRMEWSFEERSRRFVAMLHERVDRFVKGGDCVMVTIATQLEAHALAVWLAELPERRKPFIVVTFLSDRWNRGTREEYDRQVAEFAILRSTLAALSAGDARRIMLFAITELLCEELTELLGTPVAYATMPQRYGPLLPAPSRSGRPRVSLLGGTRREKGSYRIPAIIQACRAFVDVEFLVHLTNDSLGDEDARALAAIRHESNVTVLPEALPVPQYDAALASAHLALFPYELIPYRKRTSGVFGEAVGHGKPVVVTPGTWMARQIESGLATGVIAEDERPESIARAVARCVAELDSLTRIAESKIDAWRATISLPAYFDRVETELARRTAAVKPVRRFSFWR